MSAVMFLNMWIFYSLKKEKNGSMLVIKLKAVLQFGL